MASVTAGRLATAADADELGKIIGDAFRHDPVSRWTLGTETAVAAVFAALTRELYLPRGHCLLDSGRGGTLWLCPGGRKTLSLPAQMRVSSRLLRHGGSLRRALAVDATLRRERPVEPHFYLFSVGVLPAARGQGVAATLIRRTLAMADAIGLPAYLENSNPPNESLYRRLGFVPTKTFAPAPGCPSVTGMWRGGRS
ncbi:MAG: GNAT family N-acetyltransferase [Pseudomonadota bacterium]